MNNNVNTANNSLRKEIVDKADIVNIIGQYVTLEKKGANYIGLCPFHDDKNPSMSVSPQKKVFKCFSCNTGGDVITFVKKIRNISDRDAMRIVGETVGIKVGFSKKDLEFQKNKKYYDIMKESSDFYHFFLKNTSNGKKALEYLTNRGLSLDVINCFQIGLSSDKDELFSLLNSKNYLPLDMMELGLIRSYGDTYHDVFKNRIIFPLTDLDGNICGFSGRRYLESDNESKYLNTNETVIFKKGLILYNYHNAIQRIKSDDCVFLFEGFMDVIAACRANITNSVASMGTALTTYQIDAIKRLTKNVVVVYDSDEPGIMASLRAIEMLNAQGMNIKLVCIPDGKDPDEYIKKNGAEALFNYLKNNQISAMDYIYNINFSHTNINDLDSKENFKKIIFANLKKFNSKLLQETFLQKLSKDLNTTYEGLISDFNSFEAPVEKKEYINQENESAKEQVRDVKNIVAQGKFVKAERQLIYYSYKNREACLEIVSHLDNCYVDKINRDLLSQLSLYYKDRMQMNKNEFYETLTEEEIERLEDILDRNEQIEKEYVNKTIEVVKTYQMEKMLEYNKNDGKPKTLDDIGELLKLKKNTTIKGKDRK